MVERVESINVVGNNVEQSAIFIRCDLLLHPYGTPHQSHHVLKLVVSVELELLVDDVAFDEVLLENGGCPLTETSTLYGFYAITYGDDNIEIVHCCLIRLVLVFTHMCKFCTCDIFIEFALFVAIVYMTCDNSSVASKQLCHLTLCKPHCLILQLHIELYAAVLRTVYFYRIVHICFLLSN